MKKNWTHKQRGIILVAAILPDIYEGVYKLGLVDFWDYFGLFSIDFLGIVYEMLIQSPKNQSKIGSKEPENRQKFNLQTPSML